jgi:peptide chain release factor 2
VDELDAVSQAPDFWDAADKAQKLMQERGELVELIETFQKLERSIEDAGEFLAMAIEEGATAETIGQFETFLEAQGLLAEATRKVEELELARMLSGEHDGHNAYLSINSGAGGTDSQDWAEMLLRMYTRYATAKGWQVEIHDLQEGQEAGIKSADLHITGKNAYGYLKAEGGIHRLVRISPYGKQRRETSFAAVKVTPEIDDDIVIDIPAKDVREDTYRASGAGGQHVNRTDSAVRLTHIPTNTVVQCQVERSQHKNREKAWKMLRARLYQMELDAREAAANKAHAGEASNAFGSQIRSYVLHPYKQVKDLRTGVTITNTDRVLDGDLDEFIEAFLLKKGGAVVEDDEA